MDYICNPVRNLRRILGIRWQDKITNTVVLKRAKIPSLHMLLSQRRLRWLGHVHRMQDGRIPKDILYGEIAAGKRPAGRPSLRFKDVCKRDMKQTNIDETSWEDKSSIRSTWKSQVKEGIKKGEKKRLKHLAEKRARRKQTETTEPAQSTEHLCEICKKDCKSRIRLISHRRRH
ncbi:hypothetical protein Pmani_001066 [Petrolisthes manimaculis]|uniref:C2H2-type domain-containing protein n=1 Tax=Petrolisthes manimaculis TaxID=1843537 RepID=A0AAE1QKX5_9EUCA|nr:hypothetical protein Pmani_001066 [Petrolisthes manimaculis]